MSRRTDVVVVGRRAHELLDGGRLDRRLALVARDRTRIISEGALLRLLGLAEALPQAERPFTVAQLAAQTGLPVRTVETLALMDVVEVNDDGRCAFRDLVAVRAVARRLTEGASLSEVLAGLLPQSATSARVLEGDVARIGAAVSRGQMHLPLPESGNPTADDLFEQAYAAEEDGDMSVAAAFYERCLSADRSDPTAPFNLANVLSTVGRLAEARAYYERALAIDSRFVEARFNLAHRLEASGDATGAKKQLVAALKTDPAYADAWFNLATLHTRENDLAAAIRCWGKYLVLDPRGEWAEKARQSLSLCQRLVQAAGAGA